MAVPEKKTQANNLKTGLILGSVALVFFLGVLAKKIFLG